MHPGISDPVSEGYYRAYTKTGRMCALVLMTRRSVKILIPAWRLLWQRHELAARRGLARSRLTPSVWRFIHARRIRQSIPAIGVCVTRAMAMKSKPI